ncbi:hypothetical protein Tco_1231809 [Tanacetum coccineum]
MVKVAKLSIEPHKTLILSSEEVNSDDTTDKSLSGTAMQSVVQPKAPTGKKSKKKKIASSSDPKTLHWVSKSKSNETVAEAQHVEKLVATADTPKGLDASELAEDVTNGLKSLMPKRFITLDVDPKNSRLCKDLQHPTHKSQTLGVLELHSASRITESQNKRVPKVDFEQEIKDQVNDDVEITFLGAAAFDQNMEEVESNVEFMPDDEIRSILGDDNYRTVEQG